MVLSILEIASNHVLEFDPSTQERLQKLTGKTIAVEIKQFQTVYLTPGERGLALTHEEQPTNVTIKATLRALVKLSQQDIDDVELAPGELEIIGDALVGQRFAKLLSELDIDWEGLLADKVGDNATHMLGTAGRAFSDLFQQGQNSLRESVAEILKTELIVSESETALFSQHIAELQEKITNLESRVAKINKE